MSSLVISALHPMHNCRGAENQDIKFFPPKEIRHISAVRWGALGNKSVIMELNPDGEAPDMDKIKAAFKSLLEL